MSRSSERGLGTSAALVAVDLTLRCFGYRAVRRILTGPRDRRSRLESVGRLGGATRPEAPAGGGERAAGGAPSRPGAPPAAATLEGADRATARRLAARVERSSSLGVYRVPCLPRALLLERMRTARGLPARLRIGVRRTGGSVRAHAWIECADLVLDPDPRVEERFPALTP